MNHVERAPCVATRPYFFRDKSETFNVAKVAKIRLLLKKNHTKPENIRGANGEQNSC